jgi:hypothetical protein
VHDQGQGLVRGRVLDCGCGHGFDADHFGWDAYDPFYLSATAVAGLLVLPLPLASGAPYSLRQAVAPLLLIARSAVVSWLGTRPLRLALTWAWGNDPRVRDLTEQLRDHGAQLESPTPCTRPPASPAPT